MQIGSDFMNKIRQPFCYLGDSTASWIRCDQVDIPDFGKVFKGIVNGDQQVALKNAGCAYIRSFKDIFGC